MELRVIGIIGETSSDWSAILEMALVFGSWDRKDLALVTCGTSDFDFNISNTVSERNLALIVGRHRHRHRQRRRDSR